MSRRVFLDIGAYRGETVEAVVDMGYDAIHSFEPMPREFAELDRRYGTVEHVHLHNFGLSDAHGTVPVYGTNDRYEASVYPALGFADEEVVTWCPMVDASDWFLANLGLDDEVDCKINCEGSEVDILASLTASGQIWKLARVTICFDISRVPEHAHREGEVRAAMEEIGFKIPRYHLFGAARGHTHQDRIRHWLASS